MAKYHVDLYTEAWVHEVNIGIARRTLRRLATTVLEDMPRGFEHTPHTRPASTINRLASSNARLSHEHMVDLLNQVIPQPMSPRCRSQAPRSDNSVQEGRIDASPDAWLCRPYCMFVPWLDRLTSCCRGGTIQFVMSWVRLHASALVVY